MLYSIADFGAGNGKEPFILMENDTEIKPGNHLIFISDILGIDLNDKKIISAAVGKLEGICLLDESISDELEAANTKLSTILFALINELTATFSISPKWNLAKYLKAFDFQIDTDHVGNLFDKLLLYIQIASEFFKERALCFVNLKSYLTDDELVEVYKFAIYNKVMIFSIESNLAAEKLKYERKYIIDNEFDELIER